MDRRAFLSRTLLTGSAAVEAACRLHRGAPAVVVAERDRPVLTDGVQTGDVSNGGVIFWARADRPSQMLVRIGPRERLDALPWRPGPIATEDSDFTAQMRIAEVPAGAELHYQLAFASLANPRAVSEPTHGRVRTAPGPSDTRDVRIAWGGDTCGQGFGIDVTRGGLRMYDTLRRADADMLVHCGDMIYADDPIESSVPLPDGTVWQNVVTDAKSRVAQTLEDFRGAYRYNRLDEQVRALSAECPLVALWDDHEVHNNWWPGEVLTDARYHLERDTYRLRSLVRRALGEHIPISDLPDGRLYRALRYGPLLELFAVDVRSYRGPNGRNDERAEGLRTAWLGPTQRRWLVESLAASTAQWKVVACDMSLGLVAQERGAHEMAGNGLPGAPSGRELEVASLLSDLKRAGVKNVVWITADVHYAAAHHFDPVRAAFRDFDPFWEFVAGPFHAVTFGPNPLDSTFGPEVRFQRVPPVGQGSLAPSEGYQFYGTLEINGRSRALTASLWDVDGRRLYSVELEPART